MAEHTPGPWFVGGEPSELWVTPANRDLNVICDVVARGDHGTEEEWEANAQLIATSPDLLEAAEALIEAFLPTPKTASELAAYDALRAQCRRARGETA